MWEAWATDRGLELLTWTPPDLPVRRDLWALVVRIPATIAGARQPTSRDGFNRPASGASSYATPATVARQARRQSVSVRMKTGSTTEPAAVTAITPPP
jgi:hypothetical protein